MMCQPITSKGLGAFGGFSALIAVLVMLGAPHGRAPVAPGAHHSFCPGAAHTVFGGRPGRPRPKPGYAAHFVFGQRRIVGGQAPEVKLVNEGTDALRGQNGYVQRWRGRSWRKLPNPFAGSAEPLPLVIETPGVKTECIGPLTGSRWPLGKYRWVQWYKAYGKHHRPDGRHRLLATFWIIAERR